jgi:hypothetical protein
MRANLFVFYRDTKYKFLKIYIKYNIKKLN